MEEREFLEAIEEQSRVMLEKVIDESSGVAHDLWSKLDDVYNDKEELISTEEEVEKLKQLRFKLETATQLYNEARYKLERLEKPLI